MTGIIRVNDIRCRAYHGCLKEERVIGADYTVDVWIEADLSKAIRSDKLKDTVDYCIIKEIVLREMKQPSNLVEHVCSRILQSLKSELKRVHKARVKVTKINPPLNGDVRDVSVILRG